MNSITIEKETTYIITTKDEELTPIEPDQSSFNIRRVLIHVNPQNQTINIYKGKTASTKSLNKARTIAREINAKHGFRYTIKQHNYISTQNGWETYQKQKSIKTEPEPEPKPEAKPKPQPSPQTKELIQATILDTINHPLPHSLAIMLSSILNEPLPNPFPQDPQEVKKILHTLIDKLVEQNTLKN